MNEVTELQLSQASARYWMREHDRLKQHNIELNKRIDNLVEQLKQSQQRVVMAELESQHLRAEQSKKISFLSKLFKIGEVKSSCIIF